jgi:hypothetical protein
MASLGSEAGPVAVPPQAPAPPAGKAPQAARKAALKKASWTKAACELKVYMPEGDVPPAIAQAWERFINFDTPANRAIWAESKETNAKAPDTMALLVDYYDNCPRGIKGRFKHNMQWLATICAHGWWESKHPLSLDQAKAYMNTIRLQKQKAKAAAAAAAPIVASTVAAKAD